MLCCALSDRYKKVCIRKRKKGVLSNESVELEEEREDLNQLEE